jgi:arylsulfatase A-like enzyme
MKKFLLLICCAIVFTFGCKSGDDKVLNIPTAKPNILLIIADDMGVEASPGYSIGAVKPNMPNLQSMASKGITFDNVWAYPVCSPTRSSILTGKYGFHTGVLNAEDASTIDASEKTLQSFLDEKTGSAYSHAIIGKWHLSPGEPKRPTQMGVGYYAGLLGGGVSDYYRWSFTQNGSSGQFNGYITTKLTDLAILWIEDQSKPWFCWLAYNAPHTPFHLPPDEMHSQGSLPTDSASIAANPLPYYMGMCESIDYQIGRLLDRLSPTELANTIIIFIGDNGTTGEVLQAPYTSGQGKGSLYQGGINVPMIISGKGVSRTNARETSLINSTDLFSTIADIAGTGVSSYENSSSFKSMLTMEGILGRTYNYSEVLNASPNRSGFAVRDARYKLIQFDNSRQEFYDLINDPYEQNNLIPSGLNTDQQNALDDLVAKASEIRS